MITDSGGFKKKRHHWASPADPERKYRATDYDYRRNKSTDYRCITLKFRLMMHYRTCLSRSLRNQSIGMERLPNVLLMLSLIVLNGDVLCHVHVMHILANSVPDLNGYAIRSHDLLVSRRTRNLRACCTYSPYYPDREAMRHDTIVDGIEYIRSDLGSKISALKKRPGFNVPQSEPFVLRAPKYAFYKLKLGLEIAYSSVYNTSRCFGGFLGKRMMKKLRMK